MKQWSEAVGSGSRIDVLSNKAVQAKQAFPLKDSLQRFAGTADFYGIVGNQRQQLHQHIGIQFITFSQELVGIEQRQAKQAQFAAVEVAQISGQNTDRLAVVAGKRGPTC